MGMLDTQEKRDKWAWAVYDFAGASYSASIAAVFAGPYITSLAKEQSCVKYNSACHWCSDDNMCLASYMNSTVCSTETCNAEHHAGWCCETEGLLPFGAVWIGYGSYFAYLVTLSVVLQVILMPILGAIADYSNNTKKLLFWATVGGSITLALFFLADGADMWWLAGVLYVCIAIFFRAASILYDSYLNFLTADSVSRTELSSRGYAMSYFGGGVFLASCMGIYLLHPNQFAIRIIFVFAGVWWFGWSLLTFKYMRNYNRDFEEIDPEEKYAIIKGGFRQLVNTCKVVRQLPQLWLFLVAAALYNDGIQAFGSLISVFTQEAMGYDPGQIAMITILLLFSAAFGAYGFLFLARKWSDKVAILLSILMWGVLQVWFYFSGQFSQSALLSIGLGIALGGSQAVSRALFAKLIPKGFESEIYALYHLSQKGTAWMGPLVYGAVTAYFNNDPRPGFLCLIVFLGVGSFALLFVNAGKGEADANNYSSREKTPLLLTRNSNSFKRLPHVG